MIVVGAGHNGLICAAYLARAGIDTMVIEARDEVGGCASTVSDLGARFNICNCDHTLIRAMPIIDELELSAHGLRYLEAGAGSLNLYHDGSDPWFFFPEIDRQLASLEAAYPGQVAGYRRYLDDALPVAQLVLDLARARPGTLPMATTALRRRAEGANRLLDWSRRSFDEVMARYFDDWHLTMPLVTSGPTVWGVHPAVPGTGLAALGYASRHLVTTGRPEGGSGALTDAARSSLEAAGGRVRCQSRVERLLLNDGRVAGVRLDDGTELSAPVVVAACDPQRVLVDWIDEPPAHATKLIDRWRQLPTHDGYESKVDATISVAPRYRDADVLQRRHAEIELLGPTAFISPSPADLEEAHARRPDGRVARRPSILANVPSVLDPTLVTEEGHHILSVEVLFTPYDHPGGWATSDEPERWLDLWAGFMADGARTDIVSWRAMTPDRYENEFSMHRGHTPSYAGSPLAALLGRNRELTRYRTSIGGLYLSGAGTFPGAGIFGAAGRNTADAVRRDLTGQGAAARVGSLGRRLQPLTRPLTRRLGGAGRGSRRVA